MLRVLDDRDLPAVLALLDSDPVSNVFVASRVDAAGLAPERLGAQIWGYSTGSELTSLCYAGANLVPVCADAHALRAFADFATRQGRRCSSIVGPSDMVSTLWAGVEPIWGPARELRMCQPLMLTRSQAATSIDTAAPVEALTARIRDALGVAELG